MATYTQCQNNMQTQFCKDLCNAPNKPFWCDGVMTQWCSRPENQNTPQCACFDPQYEKLFPGLGISACFKPSCVSSGEAYKTSAMIALSGNCPNVCGNFVQVGNQTDHLEISGTMKAICSSSSEKCVWTPNRENQLIYLNIGFLVLLLIILAVSV